jgi:Protein of unknown function with HXXEE motif
MFNRIKTTFLLLVLTQGVHSVEEYAGRLWEVYPPARFICSLLSNNPETGFIILDIGFISFGLCCWLFCIHKDQLYAQGLIWFWIVMEMINVTGHFASFVLERKYVPGVATAPVLLILAVYLARQILHLNSILSGEKINDRTTNTQHSIKKYCMHCVP